MANRQLLYEEYNLYNVACIVRTYVCTTLLALEYFLVNAIMSSKYVWDNCTEKYTCPICCLDLPVPKAMNNFGQENNLQGYLDLAMWAANIAQKN